MNKVKTVSPSTELLAKAFSIIYDDIFSKGGTLNEISKVSDILQPIIVAIVAVGEFGQGKRTVYLINRIKELCGTIPDEDKNKRVIINLLDSVLEMTIIAESIFSIYGEVAEHLRAVTDME